MKIDNPRKTRSGFSHQTSGRIVSPNERRGSAVVPFIRRRLLPLAASLFSMLPNCREHSKDRQILPVSKYSQRGWRGNRFRSKPPLTCYDRVRQLVCATPEEKCGGGRGRVPFFIWRGDAHTAPRA